MKNVSISLITVVSILSLANSGCGNSKSSSAGADSTVTPSAVSMTLANALLGTWQLGREKSNSNQIQKEPIFRFMKFEVNSNHVNQVSYCDGSGGHGFQTWKISTNVNAPDATLFPSLGTLSFEYFQPRDRRGGDANPFQQPTYHREITSVDREHLVLDGRTQYSRVAEGLGKFEDLCDLRPAPSQPHDSSSRGPQPSRRN